MSFDLTASISSGASISSAESHKPGIRDRLLALKQKAALATGEPTDPAYANSFGERLSDLDGRRRWLLDGLAREIWDPDLCARLREILRANEGEIHKGQTIRRTATVCHCWMLGYDATHAHPTVVISCNHSTVLKRTMRTISQHGVLRETRFVLKGIPFCDLKYRMDPREGLLDEENRVLDQSRETRHDGHKQLEQTPSTGADNETETRYEKAVIEDGERDEKQGRLQEKHGQSEDIRANHEGREHLEAIPMELSMNASSQDPLALRVGAEEITIAASGRLTTLGGFIMVDDICFGLTAMHAFVEEEEDDGFGQRCISEGDSGLHLCDIDWANDEASEGDEEDSGSNLPLDISQPQQLQRVKRKVADGREYKTEAGEIRHIATSSRHFSANGLDWALCELGEWGKYAINGVYLPPELRTDVKREYLIFKKLKTTPPLGKILVATKRGPVSGYGTGADTSIKLSGDDDYRRVWSVQLEESLSSGDSGSWVVDAFSGDVYGMVVAGSTELQEEYIIPAVDIGQDICRVMRADTVRLPTWQDVSAYHRRTAEARHNGSLAMDLGAIDWESDESPDDEVLDEDEERFILAEILKHSSVKINDMIGLVKGTKLRPRWNKVALPKGRSIRTVQRAVDRLLAGYRPRRKLTEDGKSHSTLGPKQRSEMHDSTYESSLSNEQQQSPTSAENRWGDEENPLIEEPPELLDSNPNFRAEKSRRAWRAKKQAGRGPKPHHRKHHRNRKSGEALDTDQVLKAPAPIESPPVSFQSKFEVDSEDEQGNLDPDIILVRHKGSIYNSRFPAFSISEGSLLVGHLRQQIARDFGIEDASRVTLLYKGKSLKDDSRTCHEEGLMMRSEVLCVIKRKPWEELKFLTNKFRTELVPQGLEFISNPPADAEKRELAYRRTSETILTQILLKCDAMETEGDVNARDMRKNLVTEVNGFLDDLDTAMRKDEPSDWHADFLPTKQARRLSATLPGRPASSRSSNLRGSGSKADGGPDDNEFG